ADTYRDWLLTPAQALQRRRHLTMPARHVGDDVLHAPRAEPDLRHLLFVEASQRIVEGLVVAGGLIQQVVFRCHAILRSLGRHAWCVSRGEQVLRGYPRQFSHDSLRRFAASGEAPSVARRIVGVTGFSPSRGDKRSRTPAACPPSASSR